MILLILLIAAIFIVIWFDRKKQTADAKENPEKINPLLYRLLIIFLILLALFQAPILYYYTFGLFSVFITIPYISIALLVTGILIKPWIKKENISVFHKAGVSFAILMGCISTFWGSEIIEKLDWEYRLNERELIVKKALNGEIREGLLQTNYFPPISNGGNEILVGKNGPGNITITFFVDRGFIDHYTAYIYTTDKALIEDYDARTKSEWHQTNKKIDENWYRIAE